MWSEACFWRAREAHHWSGMLMWAFFFFFPAPDGQNLASSRRAPRYDWLNACPCGESVLSECFYSMYVCMYVEMERLQTEGRRTRMGSLNAIVFSCGTVTIYLAGVAVQCDGLRSPQKKAKRPPPFFPFCQLVLRTSLANWNTGNEKRTGWKITPTGRRSNFGFQICGVKRATRGESGGGAGCEALWGRSPSQHDIS